MRSSGGARLAGSAVRYIASRLCRGDYEITETKIKCSDGREYDCEVLDTALVVCGYRIEFAFLGNELLREVILERAVEVCKKYEREDA